MATGRIELSYFSSLARAAKASLDDEGNPREFIYGDTVYRCEPLMLTRVADICSVSPLKPMRVADLEAELNLKKE